MRPATARPEREPRVATGRVANVVSVLHGPHLHICVSSTRAYIRPVSQRDNRQNEFRCSFCGATRDASRVVRGPAVAICEECIERGVEIIRERQRVSVVKR